MTRGLIFIEEMAKRVVADLGKEIDAEKEKNGCLYLKSEVYLFPLLQLKMRELVTKERGLFLAKFQINGLADSLHDPLLIQEVTNAVRATIPPASAPNYSSPGDFNVDTVQATIEAAIRCLVKHARPFKKP